jgi:hypothetical protein
MTKPILEVLESTARWMQIVEENMADAILLNDMKYIEAVPANLAEVRQALENCAEVLRNSC